MTDHEEKYEKIAHEYAVDRIVDILSRHGIKAEDVQRCLEEGDEHLNMIPLYKWDKAANDLHWNAPLSMRVCLLKHVAAHQYLSGL